MLALWFAAAAEVVAVGCSDLVAVVAAAVAVAAVAFVVLSVGVAAYGLHSAVVTYADAAAVAEEVYLVLL